MTIKKKFFSVFALVLFCVFICPLYILPVSAATVTEVDIPCNRPLISDSNGYLEVLFRNDSSGVTFVRVYTWFTNPIGNNVGDTYCDIRAESSSIQLSPGFHVYNFDSTQTMGARLSLFMIDESGNIRTAARNQYYDNSIDFYDISAPGCSIIGYRAFGNAKLSTDKIPSKSNFIVNYSETSTIIDSLIELFNVVSLLESDVSSIDSNVYTISSSLIQIINNTDSIEDKLDACISFLSSCDIGIAEVNSELDKIYSSVDDLEVKLDKIISILESNLDTPLPDDVPQDSINEHNSLENGLLQDISPDFDDLDFDTDFLSSDSFLVCWNMVEMALSTHDLILLIVTVVSILGIIALILNR